MQTSFTYNGVLVKDVLSDGIEHEPFFDSTNVEQIGVLVRLTCTGVVHSSANDHTGVRSGSNLANGLPGLLQRLTKNRRRFTYQIGKVTVYDVVPGAAEPNAPPNPVGFVGVLADINHGPQVRVNVQAVKAGKTATISFSIEFVITNCGGSGTLNSTGLVNFRFWISEDVDCATWLTTRTYTGRLRVAHKNVSVHQLARAVAVPPLQKGFERKIIGLHESPNGLELDFTFQDRELVASAPWNKFLNIGASAWSGRLRHYSDTQGATSNIECSVSLTGPKGTSVLELAELCLLVIQQKIQYAKIVKGKLGFIEYFEMSEAFESNVVEAACKIKHTGNQSEYIGLFTLGTEPILGQPMGNLGIGYDSDVAFNPGTSAGLEGLFMCLLQTPCNPNTMPAVPDKRVKREKQKRIASSKRQQPAERAPTVDGQASASQLQALYMSYLMTSEISVNSGKIALPTGAASDSKASPLAVVNLHRPTAMREVRIQAERLNAQPELPIPNSQFKDQNGIDHFPVGTIDLPLHAVQLSADGRQSLYAADFTARYALSRVPGEGESLPVGAVPYRAVKQQDNSRVFPASAFVQPASILS